MERLGILGGTFDPIHIGHCAAAVHARYQLQLDRVLMVVAADPWQKRGTVVAPAESRYEMAAAAVEGSGMMCHSTRSNCASFGPAVTLTGPTGVGEYRSNFW